LLAGLKPGLYITRERPPVPQTDLTYMFRSLLFWCGGEKRFEGFDYGGDCSV